MKLKNWRPDGYVFLAPTDLRDKMERFLHKYGVAYKLLYTGLMTNTRELYDVVLIRSIGTIEPSVHLVREFLDENWPNK